MFDTLKHLFHPEDSLKLVGDVARKLVELIQVFEANSLKDLSTRNAAIDAIIQILEEEKTK